MKVKIESYIWNGTWTATCHNATWFSLWFRDYYVGEGRGATREDAIQEAIKDFKKIYRSNQKFKEEKFILELEI